MLVLVALSLTSFVTAAASGIPHEYNGEIEFDISKVPFSRYGSYLAFSHIRASRGLQEGLYLRTLHGAIPSREVFRIELLHGRTPEASKEIATPTLLRLQGPDGYAEICMAEPKVIRIRGAGVGVRLSMPQPDQENPSAEIYAEAFPFSPTQWEVNSFTQRVRFMLTSMSGNLTVDAPWQGTRSEHVVVDFLPDPESGKVSGCDRGVSKRLAAPPVQEFRLFLGRLCKSEYRQWLTEMPTVPEEFSKTAELAAYVNWESVVAPEGHLTRPAMLMSKNWMTNLWSWDNCFNAMALIQGQSEIGFGPTADSL